MYRTSLVLATLVSALTLEACSAGSSSPTDVLASDAPIALSVLPAAATTGVDPTKAISITPIRCLGAGAAVSTFCTCSDEPSAHRL